MAWLHVCAHKLKTHTPNLAAYFCFWMGVRVLFAVYGKEAKLVEVCLRNLVLLENEEYHKG